MNKRFSLLILLLFCLACGPSFYQAPPPLHQYMPRTAGKSWRLLLDGRHAPSGEWKVALVDACRDLVARLGAEPDGRMVEAIDALRQRNRDGEFSIKIANFLIEFRELVVANPGDDLRSAYLDERLDDLPGHQFTPSRPRFTWMTSDEEKEQQLERFAAELAALELKFHDRVENRPLGVRANWLVRRGAHFFRSGKHELAAADFAAVVEGFPDHARAEVAAFMLGRCKLGLARELNPQRGEPDGDRKWRVALDEAADAFADYLKRFPDGRFVSDAHGWTGATLVDRGCFSAAVNCQVRRLEVQPTREVASSVMREMDSILIKLFEDSQDVVDRGHLPSAISTIDFERLVNFPALTQQFVYHCLDSAAQTSRPMTHEEGLEGGTSVAILNRKIVRSDAFSTMILEGMARAVVESAAPLNRMSALVLGWSLLRSNHPAEALVVAGKVTDGAESDDLLQLKAAALSRLKRPAEAVAVFKRLIDKHPASPLTRASRFDMAIELMRDGRAGESWFVLVDLIHSTAAGRDASREKEPARLHHGGEILQWCDVIAQFAPIGELRHALEVGGGESPHAQRLRDVIRCRLLCRGDFEAARQYLDSSSGEDRRRRDRSRWDWQRGMHLGQVRWDREVAPLAETLARISSAEGSAKAELHLLAAQQWNALRGELTLPLHGMFDFSNSEGTLLDDQRRENAAMLGIADAQVVGELDRRDELHHALQHNLAAAAIPQASPETTRRALFGANEALFRLAEFSPYRLSRAVEQHDSQRSLQLVNRLRREFPDSPEARSAVAYSFTPPSLYGPWMPGNRVAWHLDEIVEQAVVEGHAGDSRYVEPTEAQRDAGRDLADVITQLDGLGNRRSADPKAVMDRLLETFTRIRPHLSRRQILSAVDVIDDLHAVAHVEGLKTTDFQTYARQRRRLDGTPIVGGSGLEPFLQYISCLRQDSAAASAADRVNVWEAYLEAHPAGPKSEAAALRKLRLEIRSAIAYPRFKGFHFPEAPIAIGYKTIRFDSKPPSYDPAKHLAAIAAYRRQYPAGRYAIDVDLLEASVLAAAGNHAAALPVVTQVLDSPIHVELRQDAALLFSAVGMALLEAQHRGPLVAAFREHPRSRIYLKRLAEGGTPMSRLRPMISDLSR